MKLRPPQRENVHNASDRTLSIDSGGVDELGVIPWPILLRRRIARKVGIDPRWGVLWVVLSGLFTVGFTITLLVVSLDSIAVELDTTTVGIPGATVVPYVTVIAAETFLPAEFTARTRNWNLPTGGVATKLVESAAKVATTE